MPDSIRIKEIHEEIFKLKGVLGSNEFKAEQDAGKNPKNIYEKVSFIDYALDAEKYSKDEKNPSITRKVNLGWMTMMIGQALGLSFESNGDIRAIRQKAVIRSGQPIPKGWRFGQFGLNTGNQYQKGTTNKVPQGERLGIVYECRANQLVPDPNNKGSMMIAEGDYVLAENLIQYDDEVWDDVTRALGMDELGAIAIPSADGKKIAVFEGMYQLMIETLYMLFKSFPVDVGTDTHGNMPYPGIKENVPSNYEQFSMILQNIGLILGSKLRANNDDIMSASFVDDNPVQNPIVVPDFIQKP